jgi:hypothetical protein
LAQPNGWATVDVTASGGHAVNYIEYAASIEPRSRRMRSPFGNTFQSAAQMAARPAFLTHSVALTGSPPIAMRRASNSRGERS